MIKRGTLTNWLKVLVLLLDEIVVLAAVFVVLHFVGVRIPLPVMIVVGFLIVVLVFIIHIKVIPSFHWKQATGREGMIGQQGRVVQPLTPVGTIYVRGENWKARADGDHIEADRNVEVVGVEGLILTVTSLKEEKA